MTVVSPQCGPMKTVHCWTVKAEGDKEKFETGSLFMNNNEKTLGSDAVDSDAVPRCKMTIEEGLRPLLASMKLFGLYFTRPSENKQSRRWKAYMIYAVSVVILLWLNAVRMLSTFTHEDKFGMILFSKLVAIIWSIQCAVSQTAFFAASFSGRLALAFHQVLDGCCAGHCRKFATVYTILASAYIMAGSTFYAYGLFTGYKDYMLTPLQIHIILPDPLIVRIFWYFCMFHLLAAYIFSQAVTFVLAMMFGHQFRSVTEALGGCLDKQRRQVSESDIEMLRQKHQEIAMNVSYIDDCLMFSNASAFCCQVACVVILLYTITFYHSVITDPIIITTYFFWLFMILFGLVLTAAGGISLHHYVSLFSMTVCNVRYSLLCSCSTV